MNDKKSSFNNRIKNFFIDAEKLTKNRFRGEDEDPEEVEEVEEEELKGDEQDDAVEE